MRYDLMLKDIRVAAIDIDDDDGKVSGMFDVYDTTPMPIGTMLKGRGPCGQV